MSHHHHSLVGRLFPKKIIGKKKAKKTFSFFIFKDRMDRRRSQKDDDSKMKTQIKWSNGQIIRVIVSRRFCLGQIKLFRTLPHSCTTN